MELSELTIKIIVLLLPGFFCTTIIEALTNKKKFDIRTYIVSVIILGFLSYFLLLICTNIGHLIYVGMKNFSIVKISFFDSLVSIDKNVKIKLLEVLYATMISIILGIIVAGLLNKGYIYKLFRKMHVTLKTGNDVWIDVFDNNNKSIKQFVYVVDKKYDFVYGGWLEYYSFDPDNKELYLSDVVVTKDSNRCEELRRFEKLYITYDNQNMCIEINGGKEDNDGSKK